MQDMDCANIENKVSKPKKRVAGEKVLEMLSDDELMAQFSPVRNRKKPEK
jgi:hypothetical protein